MSIDRITKFTGPCRCGKGTIKIYHCTPDHGWSDADLFKHEFVLKCRICEKDFEIQKQGRDFVYVSKNDIACRQTLKAQADARSMTLLNSAKVQTIRSNIILYLNSQRTKAAIHNILTTAHLGRGTYQTFLKHWKGAQAWAEYEFFIGNLEAIMKLLGSTDLTILIEIRAIESLNKNADVPPLPVGHPIYTL